MKREKSKNKYKYNVWYLLKDRKLYFLFANLINILATVFQVSASLIMIDEVTALFERDFPKAVKFALLELLFFTLYFGFGFIFELCKNNMMKSAMIKYRKTISFNLQKESENAETNSYISTLNNDSKQVESALTCFFTIIDSITGMTISFIGLTQIHPFIAGSSVVLFILNTLALKLFKKKSIENEKNRSRVLEGYYSDTSDDINGYDVWNLYNAKRYMRKKLDEAHEYFEKDLNVIHNWTAVFQYGSSLFNIWAQLIQHLFLVFLIFKKLVVPGAAFAVGNLSGQFFLHTKNLIQQSIQINGFNSIINEKMSSDKSLDENLKEIGEYDIEIKDLTFGYENNPIFNNLNLSLPYGKKVVITGASGSGKSTLSNILSKKIKNYEGEVFLGDKDIQEINDYTLHSYVGFMSQKPYIFSDSIKENIVLGRDEKIPMDKVAEYAYIDEFAKDLDEEIENNGENLSGGQLQRIALAREFYSPHPIIILDESVSALDQKTTEKVLNNILSLKSTVILVAHRLPDEMLEKFDEVIDIDKIKSL